MFSGSRNSPPPSVEEFLHHMIRYSTVVVMTAAARKIRNGLARLKQMHDEERSVP